MAGFTGTVEKTGTGRDVLPEEPGDHERLSHYAEKQDILRGLVEGVAIEALCGWKWVPSRDGTQFPLCPECKDIWEGLPDTPDGH